MINDRRTFLLNGAAAVGALTLGDFRRARGNDGPCAAPPFCITLRAGGGWDPTLFCDPKPGDDRFSIFDADDLLTVGDFTYAPYEVDGGVPVPYAYGGQDFFQKHFSRMVVLNGIDHLTVAHDVGHRSAMSGTTREGLPSVSGLVAGIAGRGLAMPFLVRGGYASAAGMVPLTRMAGGRTLQQILQPEMMGRRADDPAHEPEILELVRAARFERDRRQSFALPRAERTRLGFLASRGAESEAQIARFRETLTDEMIDTDNDAVTAASGIAAAMKAGICVAGHVTFSGVGSQFDSHSGSHNSLSPQDGHRPAVWQLLEAADYLADTFENDPVLAERGLVLLVGSEFGRTVYNDARGKDHWNIGSFLVLVSGAARERFELGRVVGLTSTVGPRGQADVKGAHSLKAKLVSGALEYTDDEDDPDAVRLNVGHVHVALRHAMGLCDDGLLDQPLTRYAVPDVQPTPLPLFRS